MIPVLLVVLVCYNHQSLMLLYLKKRDNGLILYLEYNNSMTDKSIKTMKCPFDPSHVMPYERFLNHLEKCQYPDKKSYRKCKFNPYHVYHMEMIEGHQNSCPDRKKYEQEDDDWGACEQEPKDSKTLVSASTSFNTSYESSIEKSQNESIISKESSKVTNQTGKNKYKKQEKVVQSNNSVMEVEQF